MREEQLAFFSDVFDQMDKDGGGDVSPLELREMFETLGIKISPEEAQAMVAMADTDGDARVSKSEFLDVIARARPITRHSSGSSASVAPPTRRCGGRRRRA